METLAPQVGRQGVWGATPSGAWATHASPVPVLNVPSQTAHNTCPCTLPQAQDLGVDAAPRLQTLSVEAPAKRKGGVILSSPAELVDRLRNEAKVI